MSFRFTVTYTEDALDAFFNLLGVLDHRKRLTTTTALDQIDATLARSPRKGTPIGPESLGRILRLSVGPIAVTYEITEEPRGHELGAVVVTNIFVAREFL